MKSHRRDHCKGSFHQTYKWLGVPMVAMFTLSAAWTGVLAVVQYDATWVANTLMETTDLDFGEFWLLEKADDRLAAPAIILLALFAVGYISLAVAMVSPRAMRWLRSLTWRVRVSPEPKASLTPGLATAIVPATSTGFVGNGSQRWSHSFTDRSASRQFRDLARSQLLHDRNPVFVLVKLIFQTTTLFAYLHEGVPPPLIFSYSSLLFLNWIIACYRFLCERPDPNFVLRRLFYCFDMFFAVFAPLQVLVFAASNFEFDKAAFATRVATLSPGIFERTARLFADPRQVSLFRIAFHYLQFTVPSTLLIKCALNVLSLFKWWNIIVHLVDNNLKAAPPAQESALVVDAPVSAAASGHERLRQQGRRQFYQNLLTATIFFCGGAGVFTYSIVAVASSNAVCDMHPQCKVPSYQWNVGADKCSCIVYVDRETAMKSYDEWLDPIDTTSSLAALAATGHLRIVQIINHELPTLPEELRGCHNLEQLVLIYTKTVTVPDWAKEFDRLRFLHLQGDFTPRRLAHLPRDLFEHMTSLMFVHLGCLVNIPFVPDFTNLHRLEYLSLAMLHSVTQVPSLASLHSLRQLNFIDDIRLDTLPPVHHLTKLSIFSVSQRSPSCCNGFMGTACDLTAFSCRNRTASGEPLVQCTTARYAKEDLAVADKTDGVVCDPNITADLKDSEPTRLSTDGACGGVMYKQCTFRNRTGICYPARLQLISCQVRPMYLDLRRLQIERGVGDPCDPTIEAWLGCRAK